MSRKFQVKAVPSTWLENNGRRLDCGPYLSGAMEARQLLRKHKWSHLRQLTKGYNGGIYNGPQFTRNYVEGPAHGVPFLTTSSMLDADFSFVSHLSRKDALSKKLSYLEISEGMTLITCSGSIGRMNYARSDMAGMWSNQDIMKVCPNEEVIDGGYLYAFLSSKYGLPLVTSGTYGAIINHIEPSHISDLPVPRFSSKLENEIGDHIRKASALRVDASKKIARSRAAFDWLLEPNHKGRSQEPIISSVRSTLVQSRLDAAYHDPLSAAVEAKIRSGEFREVSELAEKVFIPGIFKRIQADNEQYGAPYFTGDSIFWQEPKPKNILSRNTSLFDQVRISKGTVLVQAFGQKGGLIGRVAWVGKHLDQACTTHMLVRVVPRCEEVSGYLFAFLSSDAGYALIIRTPFGGSIPHFSDREIASLPVPMLGDDDFQRVNTETLEALEARDQALELEFKARAYLENAVEQVD